MPSTSSTNPMWSSKVAKVDDDSSSDASSMARLKSISPSPHLQHRPMSRASIEPPPSPSPFSDLFPRGAILAQSAVDVQPKAVAVTPRIPNRVVNQRVQ